MLHALKPLFVEAVRILRVFPHNIILKILGVTDFESGTQIKKFKIAKSI